MTDDRSAAVVLLHIEAQEVRLRMRERRHQFLVRLGRRSRILDDDVGLVPKEVGGRRLDAALLAACHRMPGDVVDARGQNALNLLPKIRLRASRIRYDRAFLEIRHDSFQHRRHLQHGRRQKHDVSALDDLADIGRRHVDRTALHGKIHGLLRAAESRDEDVGTELLL